ncbi:carbon starvation CstA family protein [Candidatus Nitrospira allomarina]|uniref:Carbon starvation CstA family protein n=1 Tax=Candidatus Nitrospira allomarina TaxID=3020900 RepID=A0AA96JTJ1_9BACT|nr:carbon starvation CstA family protein [Candidatus Nitrospira allomarina]WNM59578.1 carbon starvation CstA family protein [Candidatus Nitrospira allomarina]
MSVWNKIGWLGLAGLCAVAFGHVVGLVNPHEKVNGLWLVVAASCFYVLAYRFYGRFLAQRVMNLDDRRRTPAHRLEDGTNFYPANKYILFGHHFAAIAGAGPLLGPVLAAQFGFLPGFLWIVIGAVLAGAVQDFIILVASMRRNGRSLPEIAHAELGPITGMATAIAVLFIVVVALAGLGLAVVNALYHNAWGTFTIVMTIPIALLMGLYLQKFRQGQVGEMTLIGLGLLIVAILVGRTVAQSEWAEWFLWDRTTLTWSLAAYGFLASVLPVWMLLVPRDYLSTFMKLGVIALLAVGVIVLAPTIEMPRTTIFTAGNGPIIPGTLFPFLFITIACGAISGFHSLVSSGTTPKLISRESQAIVGYGAMLLESFVGVVALIAACLLVPGDYFAINTSLSADTLQTMGFPTAHITELSTLVEVDVSGRPGGAVSLAVGMASIFSSLPGMSGLMAYWYQFALLFEALFILTTIDAGTRVARYLVQELGGRFYTPLKQINWWPGVLGASLFVVGAWGYLIGTGSIATIWPMFGAANQLLGMLALCIATTVLIKMNKTSYLWVTVIPMVFVGVITLAGCYELLVIFINRALSTDGSQSLTMAINASLVGLVAILALIVLTDSARKWYGYLIHKHPLNSTEVIEGEGIQLPAGRCC